MCFLWSVQWISKLNVLFLYVPFIIYVNSAFLLYATFLLVLEQASTIVKKSTGQAQLYASNSTDSIKNGFTGHKQYQESIIWVPIHL